MIWPNRYRFFFMACLGSVESERRNHLSFRREVLFPKRGAGMKEVLRRHDATLHSVIPIRAWFQAKAPKRKTIIVR